MAAIIETKENEKDGLLKTHYYKTSYDEMKDVYLHFLEDQCYRVVSIEDGYNEIFAEIPHMTVTAKIIEQTPRETSIDFYISAEFLFGNTKKGLSFIQQAYRELEKHFELKGLGLHQ